MRAVPPPPPTPFAHTKLSDACLQRDALRRDLETESKSKIDQLRAELESEQRELKEQLAQAEERSHSQAAELETLRLSVRCM